MHSPAKAGMLAHRGGVGAHPTYSQQQQQHSQSHVLFLKTSDSLWHFPGERDKVAEKRGTTFQHLSHCSPQEWGHRKKKLQDAGFQISEARASSNLKLPSEGFTFFAVYRHSAWQHFFCQLMKKQDLHLAQGTHSNTGSVQACCCLLAHYLKIPIYCSQFEAAEKLALLWYFMWNNY